MDLLFDEKAASSPMSALHEETPAMVHSNGNPAKRITGRGVRFICSLASHGRIVRRRIKKAAVKKRRKKGFSRRYA